MPYSAAPSTAVHSRGRNCRGAEWHKKGYRDMGCIWINMKRLCYDRPFTRGRDVSEHWDVGKLCNDLIRDINTKEGFPLPEGCYMNFQYNRGKSVLDLPSEDPVTDYFDGGETINVKAFDHEGTQIICIPGQGWVYK